MQVLTLVGRWIALLGLAVVGFVAFELWGTGLLTAAHQSGLRSELARVLPSVARQADARAAAERQADSRRRPQAGSQPPSPPSPPEVAPPMATPAPGQPVASIDIPSIGLDMVVVQGVAAPQLALGPGHYPGTPLPGEAGNVAIAGHRTTYLHPFYNLTAVRPGTDIILTTSAGVFDYIAGAERAVAPTDVSVIGAASGNTLTLTTCNPRYSAATRLVLTASLAGSRLFSTADPATAGPGPAPGAPSTTTTTTTTATSQPPAPPHRRAAAVRTTAGGPSALERSGPAIAWGVGCAACLVGTRWLLRHRPRHWVAVGAGGAVTLVVAFFFYAALAAALPSSL